LSGGTSLVWHKNTLNTPTYLQFKVALEGVYDTSTGLMSNDLQNDNLLPYTHPYFRPPYLYFDELLPIDTLPNNVVDWVLVEARTTTTANSLVERKIALLRHDGILLSTDGSEFVRFNTLDDNQAYYFVIRHRNHLDVMTAIPIEPTVTDSYDFTIGISQAYGINQMKMMPNGTSVLYVGDYSSDGVINVFDFNAYGVELGLLNNYLTADGNMDKIVSVSDFNIYQPNASIIGIYEVRY